MNRYPAHLVSQARRLVLSDGLSYSEVAKRLRVHNSSVSIWCRGLAGTRWNTIIERNEAKRKLLLRTDKIIVNRIKVDQDKARLFSAIIYGCEGSKYPASNGVMLTNSDPELVSTFVNLLRIAFNIDENKWRAHLQIHTDQNYSTLKSYWSNLLKISESRFYKPTVTSPNGKKHRNEYLGTCTAKYYDYSIQLRLIGIFEEFMRKFGKLESGQDGNATAC